METKCVKCKYKDRKKHAHPCKVCLEKSLKERPITCDECRFSWYECSKRGKNQRRLRICEDFKWD